MKAWAKTLGAMSLAAMGFLGSCTTEPKDDEPNPPGEGSGNGVFRVSLVEATATTVGRTQVQGRVNDGPTPSTLKWTQAGSSGECRLYKPVVPFCSTPCGSSAACVDDEQCMDYPKGVGVGQVTVAGMQMEGGATSFTMNPTLYLYQPRSVTFLYPPFAEGDVVTLSAAGDTAFSPFTVSASGIRPLDIPQEVYPFEEGKALQLTWTAPANPSQSRIHVEVDISHHGGIKGKIECDAADDGSLDIAASLVDGLLALGVAGFPMFQATRSSVGTNSEAGVSLELESMVTRFLSIPGLTSCNVDEDCPDGQSCLLPDLRCE